MSPSPNYRRAFWTSRHHLWLALLTVGLGFASGQPLGLIAGLAAYALGLVYLPDAAFFRRAVDARENAARDSANAAQLAAFQQQQTALLTRLSSGRRARHQDLVNVCGDIEAASADAQGPTELETATRRQKLAELTWTYLRMLAVEQTLEVYLETERKERVPAAVKTLEAETQALAAEIAALKQPGAGATLLSGKERLLTSRLERLDTLQQRLRRIEQAQANHDLVASEQERLVEQVKLIRADAIAAKNADALAARIDLSIAHLATTNQWLSELAEFKELSSPVPPIAAAHPPPPPAPTAARTAHPAAPTRQN
jgi:hypothetical protein